MAREIETYSYGLGYTDGHKRLAHDLALIESVLRDVDKYPSPESVLLEVNDILNGDYDV